MSDKRILKNYKQSGKRFTPSFMSILAGGKFDEVDWVHNFVPELLWIGLIFKHFSFDEAYQVVLSIGNLALKITCPNEHEPARWFAPASSFNELSKQERKQFQLRLKLQSYFKHFIDSLKPLFAVFPKYPLCSLFESELVSENDNHDYIKETLKEMFPRHNGLLANRVQLVSVDLAIQSKALIVLPGLNLNRIEEAKQYPQTEDSKLIVQSARCALSGLLQRTIDQQNTTWHDELWYKLRHLEECYFEADSQHELYDLIYLHMTEFN